MKELSRMVENTISLAMAAQLLPLLLVISTSRAMVFPLLEPTPTLRA
jgi:hypothetical protein